MAKSGKGKSKPAASAASASSRPQKKAVKKQQSCVVHGALSRIAILTNGRVVPVASRISSSRLRPKSACRATRPRRRRKPRGQPMISTRTKMMKRKKRSARAPPGAERARASVAEWRASAATVSLKRMRSRLRGSRQSWKSRSARRPKRRRLLPLRRSASRTTQMRRSRRRRRKRSSSARRSSSSKRSRRSRAASKRRNLRQGLRTMGSESCAKSARARSWMLLA